MPKKLLTDAELRAAAEAHELPAETHLRKAFTAEVKASADPASRIIDFTISTASVDRMGDTIAIDGWKLDNYRKSPVVLWAHDSSSLPVAKGSNVRIEGGKLKASAEFMPREISGFADAVFLALKGGYLSAVSVGFVPIKYSFVDDPTRRFGIDFEEQELLEFSVVPVPANAEALIEARAAGLDIEPFREWAEKMLDGAGSILIPRDLLEETFRQAKTPRTVRQKYLAKAEGSDWKVGAAADLPTDDSDGWDGPAAAKRMLDDAGFDGDSPDAAKAARGFLIHDAASPTLRGSYKLPFADIVGGTLKAIKGGVSAAKGRLDQTDAPAAVLDDAKAVVAGYEAKFGEDKGGNAADLTVDIHCDTSALQERLAGIKTDLNEVLDLMAKAGIQPAPVERAGRRISSANEAQLREAMGHHESATKCIQTVLDSNAAAGADDDTDPNDLEVEVPLTDEAKRAKRIREAKALRASVTA